MFTVIENGEVYTPDPVGVKSVLIVGDKIARIGEVDTAKFQALGLECQVIDASGRVVTPGLIDPHEHITGAGGEQGFGSRTPEVLLSQLTRSGITTVVGCLGTDTSTRHLTTLLGKAKQFQAEGLSAYIYTGGFQVPTPTITDSIMNDLILLDWVIGVGEIAISDTRSVEPTIEELAKLISSTLVAGMLSGKGGVTHFHVGPGKRRLSLLNQLLDNYEIPPECIYPTHTNRTQELMDEAIALARRGAFVDIDTTEEGLGKWLRYYRDKDGPLGQLTISSDAHTNSGSPLKLYKEFVSSVREYKLKLEEVLPFFTRNTSRVLKLPNKGGLEPEKDADVLVLKKETLEIIHVFARGRQMIKDGEVVVKGQCEFLATE